MEITVDKANIAEVLASSKVVVIDFWATWCGPCRALAPVVEEVASQYDGRAVVAKCNVDESEDVSLEYGIRNIPTILFFQNGELKDRAVGVVSAKDIAAKIDNLL